MALYSKFCGSELIRSGLNKALVRVRSFSRTRTTTRTRTRATTKKNMILRARQRSEPINTLQINIVLSGQRVFSLLIKIYLLLHDANILIPVGI